MEAISLRVSGEYPSRLAKMPKHEDHPVKLPRTIMQVSLAPRPDMSEAAMIRV
jgi:hypothetical protein